MTELTITIPGKLDRLLNPNHAARNPQAKARARREAKDMGFLYGKQAAHRADITGVDRATYDIELGKAKGEKQKDQDNLVASVKGHLDGIARALGVDDRGWKLGTVTQVRDSEGIGYLRITLRWDQANEEAA